MTTPHKDLLIQARDALLSACGGRCNAEYNPCEAREVADALTAAIDAPGPEPVGYAVRQSDGDYDGCVIRRGDFYASHGIPVFTHPPAVREPLTDAEIDAAWRSVDYQASYDQFRLDVGRAIEAAHGIKS